MHSDRAYCTGKPDSYNKFYPWSIQNYTGNWVSDIKDCPLRTLSEADVKHCFLAEKQKQIIAIDGDSISRQYFVAMKLFLHQRTSGFLDSVKRRLVTMTENSSNPEMDWYRNSGLKGDYKVDVRFVAKLEKEQNRTIPINIFEIPNTTMLILGPKFLHPVAQKYERLSDLVENAIKDGNLTKAMSKAENIHRIFVRTELPKIKTYLAENLESYVYLVAQHFVHRDSHTVFYSALKKLCPAPKFDHFLGVKFSKNFISKISKNFIRYEALLTRGFPHVGLAVPTWHYLRDFF